MTHRVEFGGGAQVQFHSLPQHAQDALIQRAVDVSERPWDGALVRPPGNDPRFREATFGQGYGLIGFHVDDDAELILIFDIVWIG